jgi:hypothetical protein
MRTSLLLLAAGLATGAMYGQSIRIWQDAAQSPQAIPAPPAPSLDLKHLFKNLRPEAGKGLGNGQAWIWVQPSPGAFPKFEGFSASLKPDLRGNVCAVPLLEAPIPKARHFRTPVLGPETPAVSGTVDTMPEAQLPAPSCADKTR